MVFLRMTLARRVQSILVGGGCGSIALGVGVVAGIGAGLIALGVLAVAYGLLMVDDGAGR